MPARHDLRCTSCGHVESDQFFTLADIDLIRAGHRSWKDCPTCKADTGQLIPMEILYTQSAHNLLREDFVIDVHDGHTNYNRRVSSLTELRAIERESERHARNEPGCTPLVFRDFSQSKSNRTVNTLANTSWERGRSRRPESQTTHAGRIAARAVQDPT